MASKSRRHSHPSTVLARAEAPRSSTCSDSRKKRNFSNLAATTSRLTKVGIPLYLLPQVLVLHIAQTGSIQVLSQDGRLEHDPSRALFL